MNNKSASIPVITVDGPSGTGKGTISLLLAKHLGWHYLDSGAIYRVLALAAKKQSIAYDDTERLLALASNLDLDFEINDSNSVKVLLNNKDVTREVRSESCGKNASLISSNPQIRAALLERQRDFAKSPGLITDGRDMGTVVFPRATLKLYLNATLEERAKRRYSQLQLLGNAVNLEQVVDELAKRDERDTNRAHSPLKPAADAIIIDTTNLNITQLFGFVLELTEEHLKI